MGMNDTALQLVRTTDAVVARSPDRATAADRRSPASRWSLDEFVETFGQAPWHGQETVPQQGARLVIGGCAIAAAMSKPQAAISEG
jgi:hypothetical protein